MDENTVTAFLPQRIIEHALTYILSKGVRRRKVMANDAAYSAPLPKRRFQTITG